MQTVYMDSNSSDEVDGCFYIDKHCFGNLGCIIHDKAKSRVIGRRKAADFKEMAGLPWKEEIRFFASADGRGGMETSEE